MHRWDPAGLPLYRARPLNDTNYFYDIFNGGGSPPISSCNMDTYKEALYAAGLPALISTGITLLYLLLKAYQFAVHALPDQTERRLAAATPSGRQQVHSSIAGEKGYQEVHEQVPGNISDEYGEGSNNPPGPFLYQEDGKTYASLPAEMLRNIQSSHLYEKMQKDCKAKGIDIPKTMMAKDPVAHMMTPQEYLQKVAAGQMPKMNNHEMMVELAAKNNQTQLLMMEFWDVETPKNK